MNLMDNSKVAGTTNSPAPSLKKRGLNPEDMQFHLLHKFPPSLPKRRGQGMSLTLNPEPFLFCSHSNLIPFL